MAGSCKRACMCVCLHVRRLQLQNNSIRVLETRWLHSLQYGDLFEQLSTWRLSISKCALKSAIWCVCRIAYCTAHVAICSQSKWKKEPLVECWQKRYPCLSSECFICVLYYFILRDATAKVQSRVFPFIFFNICTHSEWHCCTTLKWEKNAVGGIFGIYDRCIGSVVFENETQTST